MNNLLASIINDSESSTQNKQQFLHRLSQGKLTRKENPRSHMCVYFAAYDAAAKSVFIGHHKKSGLWLFNGGHMDPGETPADTATREAAEEWGLRIPRSTLPHVELVTLTKIEHPELVICEWHYDFWHFLPFDNHLFSPKKENLDTEFYSYGWVSYDEAEKLLTSQPTHEALRYLRKRK